MFRADLVDLAIGGAALTHDRSWSGSATLDGGWAYVLQAIQCARTAAPYEPEDFLPLVHFGINDIQQHAHDGIGNPRTVFKTSLRTVLSRLCTARVFEDSDSSVAFGGGTWRTVTDMRRNSGLSYRPMPANGATFTITLPADFEGGTVAVGFTVWPTSDGQITWSGTASVLPSTTSLAGLANANGGSGNRRDSSNGHVVRISGLVASDAGKTIIGTYGSGAGTTFATPAAPGAITQGGTAGTTAYGYKRVYRTYNGDTIPSTETTTATGNATLTSTNFNTVPAGPAWPAGVDAEIIVRSSSSGTPASTGIIAVLTSGPAAVNDIGNVALAYTTMSANPLTGGAAFDYWQIEANNPVTRGVVININRIQNAAYLNGASDTDVANYNADIASVLSEFATNQWLLVDADAALNKSASLFASDGLHPNDRGHGTIAAAIFSAVSAWSRAFSTSDVASQARVMKRVTARRLITQQYADSLASSNMNRGIWVPANGVIAAGSLPFTGVGTADYTLDTTVRLIDTTNLVVSIDALPGDDIEIELSAMATNTAARIDLDVAVLDASNAVIRYLAANPPTPTTFGGFGWPAWNAPNEAVVRPISGKAFLTVQLGDLVTVNSVPGQIKLGLVGRTGSGTRLLYGGGQIGSPPLCFHMRNVGRRNNGFNAS